MIIKNKQPRKHGNSWHFSIPIKLINKGKLDPKKRYDFEVKTSENEQKSTQNDKKDGDIDENTP